MCLSGDTSRKYSPTYNGYSCQGAKNPNRMLCPRLLDVEKDGAYTVHNEGSSNRYHKGIQKNASTRFDFFKASFCRRNRLLRGISDYSAPLLGRDG